MVVNLFSITSPMKKILTLGLLLAGLFETGSLAAAKKTKPGQPKPIERTRRHLHRESMQRVHRSKAHR